MPLTAEYSTGETTKLIGFCVSRSFSISTVITPFPSVLTRSIGENPKATTA